MVLISASKAPASIINKNKKSDSFEKHVAGHSSRIRNRRVVYLFFSSFSAALSLIERHLTETYAELTGSEATKSGFTPKEYNEKQLSQIESRAHKLYF